MQMLTSRVIDEVVAQVAQWYAAGVNLRASLNISIRDLHSEEVATRLPPSWPRTACRRADPGRDHRERADRRPGAAARDDRPAGGGGRRDLAGRLRHRLLVAAAPAPAADRRDQDRPLVRGRHRAQRRRRGDRAVHRRAGPGARDPGGGRGRGEPLHRQLLAEAGCGLAQGWLYARPMPGDEVTAWLTRHASASPTIGAA